MLEAKKSELFERIFAVYNKNLLKRKFNSINISGIENLKNLSLPSLVYANHSSWWDGLVAFQISKCLNLKSFIMMEEKQLKKLQLFRKLGAFSVIKENFREAYKSVEYASNLLKTNSQNTVWIFPQGEILPNDTRPFNFFNGLAHIFTKVEHCSAIPLVFRYEFLGNFKPDIFIKTGQPFVFDSKIGLTKKEISENFNTTLVKLLDELKYDIATNNLSNFQSIL